MEQNQDILIGRDAEIKHLESIALSKEAEFVVVYGGGELARRFLSTHSLATNIHLS